MLSRILWALAYIFAIAGIIVKYLGGILLVIFIILLLIMS